jgi:hypothetical protein
MLENELFEVPHEQVTHGIAFRLEDEEDFLAVRPSLETLIVTEEDKELKLMGCLSLHNLEQIVARFSREVAVAHNQNPSVFSLPFPDRAPGLGNIFMATCRHPPHPQAMP